MYLNRSATLRKNGPKSQSKVTRFNKEGLKKKNKSFHILFLKGGIASSLDDVWSPSGSLDPSTLVSVLERFHHDQYARKNRVKEDVSWNGILQNILSFRLADGSFHDADGSSDLR